MRRRVGVGAAFAELARQGERHVALELARPVVLRGDGHELRVEHAVARVRAARRLEDSLRHGARVGALGDGGQAQRLVPGAHVRGHLELEAEVYLPQHLALRAVPQPAQ